MAVKNKISVIVPTYKRVDLLNRCMKSLMKQSFTDFEVIVVDNDGSDETDIKNTLQQINDDRFKYVHQPVAGVSAARNKGIELANSDLILFVDDDDEVNSEILQQLVDFMFSSDQADVAFTWCGVLKRVENEEDELVDEKGFFIDQADLSNMSFILKIGTGCGLCVRKNDLVDVGCFDEAYKLSEDRNLIIKLIESGRKYRPLNKLLYIRHYHAGERLSQSLHVLDEARHDAKLYHNHFDYIKRYPELHLRLLDLMAKHLFYGDEVDKSIQIAHKAWKIRPYRFKGIRRLMYYQLKKYLFMQKKKLQFNTSEQYWKDRYKIGKNSGVGSYGVFAEFKADVLNQFVKDMDISTIIEFGSGDGNQLHLAEYKQYVGYDVSETAIAICREEFKSDNTKQFHLSENYSGEKAELVLSLDVIYHLVEDDVYNDYMKLLFSASIQYVIIYSSNVQDDELNKNSHVRHRKFTDWVESNATEWTLIDKVVNKYPYKGDYKTGSFADFYIYKYIV